MDFKITEKWLFLKNWTLPFLSQKCLFSLSFFHPIFVVLSDSALLPILLTHQPPSLTQYHPLPPPCHHLPSPLWHHFHSCEWLQMTPSWWRRFLSQQLSLTSDGQHHDSNYGDCNHYPHQHTGSLDMTTMNNHPKNRDWEMGRMGLETCHCVSRPRYVFFVFFSTTYLFTGIIDYDESTTMNVHHTPGQGWVKPFPPSL